jgi:hypothetical protein
MGGCIDCIRAISPRAWPEKQEILLGSLCAARRRYVLLVQRGGTGRAASFNCHLSLAISAHHAALAAHHSRAVQS